MGDTVACTSTVSKLSAEESFWKQSNIKLKRSNLPPASCRDAILVRTAQRGTVACTSTASKLSAEESFWKQSNKKLKRSNLPRASCRDAILVRTAQRDTVACTSTASKLSAEDSFWKQSNTKLKKMLLILSRHLRLQDLFRICAGCSKDAIQMRIASRAIPARTTIVRCQSVEEYANIVIPYSPIGQRIVIAQQVLFCAIGSI